MKGTIITQMLVRICGLILIILGILFWTGHARSWIPIHMLLGLIFVIALWVLAGIGARAHVGAGFVALVVIWAIIVLALGMTQTRLLPGPSHWVIQVLHLLVGLAAMGLGESLAGRIKAARG
ncbi:MAG TPA: hypothetical protein VF166_09160 [Gemmatimonadaceae bacterium]